MMAVFLFLLILSSLARFNSFTSFPLLRSKFYGLDTLARTGTSTGISNNIFTPCFMSTYSKPLHGLDLVDVFHLNSEYFTPKCADWVETLALNLRVIYFSSAKLFFPNVFGYTLLGLRISGTRELVGCIDLSLQACEGSLDDLKLRPLLLRQRNMDSKGELQPYLCNLLVKEKYRRRGYGKKLIDAAADYVASQGHQSISLHVEANSFPALSLYLKEGFQIVSELPYNHGVFFMRKNVAET